MRTKQVASFNSARAAEIRQGRSLIPMRLVRYCSYTQIVMRYLSRPSLILAFFCIMGLLSVSCGRPLLIGTYRQDCLDGMAVNILHLKQDSTFVEEHHHCLPALSSFGSWTEQNNVVHLKTAWIEPQMSVAEVRDTSKEGLTLLFTEAFMLGVIDSLWFDTVLTPLQGFSFSDSSYLLKWTDRNPSQIDSLKFSAKGHIFRHSISDKHANVFRLEMNLPDTFFRGRYTRTLLFRRGKLFILQDGTISKPLEPCAFYKVSK